jgi:hypothetical protein
MSEGRVLANANAMRFDDNQGDDPLANDTPLRFTELVSDFEDETPLELETASERDQPSVENVHSTEPQQVALMDSTESVSQLETSRHPSALKVFICVIISATILGVLFAWSLISTRVQSEQSSDAVIFKKDSK